MIALELLEDRRPGRLANIGEILEDLRRQHPSDVEVANAMTRDLSVGLTAFSAMELSLYLGAEGSASVFRRTWLASLASFEADDEYQGGLIYAFEFFGKSQNPDMRLWAYAVARMVMCSPSVFGLALRRSARETALWIAVNSQRRDLVEYLLEIREHWREFPLIERLEMETALLRLPPVVWRRDEVVRLVGLLESQLSKAKGDAISRSDPLAFELDERSAIGHGFHPDSLESGVVDVQIARLDLLKRTYQQMLEVDNEGAEGIGRRAMLFKSFVDRSSEILRLFNQDVGISRREDLLEVDLAHDRLRDATGLMSVVFGHFHSGRLAEAERLLILGLNSLKNNYPIENRALSDVEVILSIVWRLAKLLSSEDPKLVESAIPLAAYLASSTSLAVGRGNARPFGLYALRAVLIHAHSANNNEVFLRCLDQLLSIRTPLDVTQDHNEFEASFEQVEPQPRYLDEEISSALVPRKTFIAVALRYLGMIEIFSLTRDEEGSVQTQMRTLGRLETDLILDDPTALWTDFVDHGYLDEIGDSLVVPADSTDIDLVVGPSEITRRTYRSCDSSVDSFRLPSLMRRQAQGAMHRDRACRIGFVLDSSLPGAGRELDVLQRLYGSAVVVIASEADLVDNELTLLVVGAHGAIVEGSLSFPTVSGVLSLRAIAGAGASEVLLGSCFSGNSISTDLTLGAAELVLHAGASAVVCYIGQPEDSVVSASHVRAFELMFRGGHGLVEALISETTLESRRASGMLVFGNVVGKVG